MSDEEDPPDDDSADDYPSPVKKTPAVKAKPTPAAAAAPLKTPAREDKAPEEPLSDTLPPISPDPMVRAAAVAPAGMAATVDAPANTSSTVADPADRYAALEARCGEIERRDAAKGARIEQLEQRLANLEQRLIAQQHVAAQHKSLQ